MHSWWVFHICNLLEGELWIFCTKNIQYPKVQGLKGLESWMFTKTIYGDFIGSFLTVSDRKFAASKSRLESEFAGPPRVNLTRYLSAINPIVIYSDCIFIWGIPQANYLGEWPHLARMVFILLALSTLCQALAVWLRRSSQRPPWIFLENNMASLGRWVPEQGENLYGGFPSHRGSLNKPSHQKMPIAGVWKPWWREVPPIFGSLHII